MDNFSPVIAPGMQFSEIIGLPSRKEIVTRLHGALAVIAGRKIARI